MVAGLDTSSALGAFERMEEKVMSLEAQAEAVQMVSFSFSLRFRYTRSMTNLGNAVRVGGWVGGEWSGWFRSGRFRWRRGAGGPDELMGAPKSNTCPAAGGAV